jgi:hypothetical protein
MIEVIALVGYVPPRCEVKTEVNTEAPKVTCNFEGAKIRIEGNYLIVEAP